MLSNCYAINPTTCLRLSNLSQYTLTTRCNDYVANCTSENTYAITRAGSVTAPILGKTQFIVSLDVMSGKYICTARCGKSTYKGKSCVHIVKVNCLKYYD